MIVPLRGTMVTDPLMPDKYQQVPTTGYSFKGALVIFSKWYNHGTIMVPRRRTIIIADPLMP